MLTKPDLIGQMSQRAAETRDSREVRQPGIWTRKFLRRTMNMALGAPIAEHGASQAGAGWDPAVVPDAFRLMLSICIDAG
jgi:hypothetical protein